MPSRVRGPGRSPPRRGPTDARDGAFDLCLQLAALGPQGSIKDFVAASHGAIAKALGSASGHLAIAVRHRPPEGDPLLGWRLAVFYAIGAASQREIHAVEHEMSEETYLQDRVVQEVVRDAGQHRIYHDPDPRGLTAWAGTLDVKYWDLLGLVDRLKVVYALTPEVELHLAIDRGPGQPRFLPRDVAVLEEMLRGLEPWVQRVALLHGYPARRTPLSKREREVACALVGSVPVKVIAGDLCISEARARELVRAVYRKLGVGNRLELASAWAGDGTRAAVQSISVTSARKPMGLLAPNSASAGRSAGHRQEHRRGRRPAPAGRAP